MVDAIDAWHNYVRSPDPAALRDLLDADVVFDSPVVHATQHGSVLTHAYLTAAASVLGGDSFRYIGEWRGKDGAVLEFVTEIDGVTINGVDIIRLTADGQRIAAFKVMIRPLKAVDLVHQLMAAMLGPRRRPTIAQRKITAPSEGGSATMFS